MLRVKHNLVSSGACSVWYRLRLDLYSEHELRCRGAGTAELHCCALPVYPMLVAVSVGRVLVFVAETHRSAVGLLCKVRASPDLYAEQELRCAGCMAAKLLLRIQIQTQSVPYGAGSRADLVCSVCLVFGAKHYLVGSADAAKPAQQNRTAVRR